jgi:hypothetical protein
MSYCDDKNPFWQPVVDQYGKHMVMTNVYKPTKTKYWNIDTRFQDHSNGSQWLYFTLPEKINDVKSIRVSQFELPISFFNISSSINNNLIMINDTLITIPDGTYSATSLKNVIQNALDANSFSNLIYDISNNGNAFSSFHNSTGSPISISFSIPDNVCNQGINPNAPTLSTNACNPVGPCNIVQNKNSYLKSKLGWILGFRESSYTIADTSVLFSTAVIDFHNHKYLYLTLDEFSNSNANSFVSALPSSVINKSILARITLDPVQYPIGSLMPANQYNGRLLSDTRTYNGTVDLQKMKLQLIHDDGLPVNLNGLDFSFSLEIQYE